MANDQQIIDKDTLLNNVYRMFDQNYIFNYTEDIYYAMTWGEEGDINATQFLEYQAIANLFYAQLSTVYPPTQDIYYYVYYSAHEFFDIFEILYADLNWDGMVTFPEYVKANIQYYTEFDPYEVDGFVEASHFNISQDCMELMDYNSDAQINETEFFTYNAFMHLWANATENVAGVTEIPNQPSFIPNLYWDYMDINQDGALTIDEFCVAA